MAIKVFDRAACTLLRAEVDAALKAVATKHGIGISMGRMTFSANNIKGALEMATISDGTVVNTQERTNFRIYAAGYGLEPEDLDRIFINKGDRYQITGIKARAQRYPILAKNLRSGQTYKFPAPMVKRMLEASPKGTTAGADKSAYQAAASF